jgi:hypothetical protein
MKFAELKKQVDNQLNDSKQNLSVDGHNNLEVILEIVNKINSTLIL